METKEEILAKAKELKKQASMLESKVYKTFLILYRTQYDYYSINSIIETNFTSWLRFRDGVYMVSGEDLTTKKIQEIFKDKCKNDDGVLLVLSVHKPGFSNNLDDNADRWVTNNVYYPYTNEDNV